MVFYFCYRLQSQSYQLISIIICYISLHFLELLPFLVCSPVSQTLCSTPFQVILQPRYSYQGAIPLIPPSFLSPYQKAIRLDTAFFISLHTVQDRALYCPGLSWTILVQITNYFWKCLQSLHPERTGKKSQGCHQEDQCTVLVVSANGTLGNVNNTPIHIFLICL